MEWEEEEIKRERKNGKREKEEEEEKERKEDHWQSHHSQLFQQVLCLSMHSASSDDYTDSKSLGMSQCSLQHPVPVSP